MKTLNIRWIKNRWHVSGNPHREMIFRGQAIEASRCKMHSIFTWLSIGVPDFTTFYCNAIAKLPLICQHRIFSPAPRGEAERLTSFSRRRMFSDDLGMSSRNFRVDYL